MYDTQELQKEAKSMKVLVIGSGGREHSLCWAIAKSDKCDELYCAPGNAGIDQVAITVPITVDDLDAIMDFVHDNGVDLIVYMQVYLAINRNLGVVDIVFLDLL